MSQQRHWAAGHEKHSSCLDLAGQSCHPTSGFPYILLNQLPHSPLLLVLLFFSRPQHKASYLTVQCKECRAAQVVPCKPGLGGALLPRRCETVDPVTNKACPLNSWVVLGERSRYVDQQTLKLQVRCCWLGWMM
jgi:hypothetical protein